MAEVVFNNLSRTEPTAQVVLFKYLSVTDATVRLALPSDSRPNFVGLEGSALRVTDWNGDVWEFRFSTRNRGHPRPVFTGGWLRFARAKRLQVNDFLIFTRLEDGQYKIHVFRYTNLRLMGANVGLIYVDQDSSLG